MVRSKAVTRQRNALAVIQIHLNRARHRHQRPSQANPPVEHKHSITFQSNIREFDSTTTGFGTFIYAVSHCMCKTLGYAHSFTYNNTTNFYRSSQVFKHIFCLVLETSVQYLKLNNELFKCIHQQIFYHYRYIKCLIIIISFPHTALMQYKSKFALLM